MHPKRLHREDSAEPRYDSSTLRKVTALAERLKERHLETITAREMEAVGAEVGLDPAFIQEALAQLAAPPVPQAAGGLVPAPSTAPTRPKRAEFWSALAAWAIAFIVPAFTLLISSQGLTSTGELFIEVACVAAPLPLAGVVGLLAGQRKTGLASAAALGAGFAPS